MSCSKMADNSELSRGRADSVDHPLKKRKNDNDCEEIITEGSNILAEIRHIRKEIDSLKKEKS